MTSDARPVDLGSDDPILERGDGLHLERTDLAWTRSGIALLAAFGILVRRVWTDGAEGTHLLAVVFLGLAAFGWAVGILGWRFAHHRGDDVRPRDPRELLAVTAGTVAVAIAGLIVILAGG